MVLSLVVTSQGQIKLIKYCFIIWVFVSCKIDHYEFNLHLNTEKATKGEVGVRFHERKDQSKKFLKLNKGVIIVVIDLGF